MLLTTTPLRFDMLWVLVAMTTGVFLMLFLGFAIYLRQRRIERENFYRFELRKKAIEAGVSGDTLLQMQLQEERITQRRARATLRFGGVLALTAGLAMTAIAKETGHPDTMAIAFLPAVIGAGYLIYAQWFAPKGDEPKK